MLSFQVAVFQTDFKGTTPELLIIIIRWKFNLAVNERHVEVAWFLICCLIDFHSLAYVMEIYLW